MRIIKSLCDRGIVQYKLFAVFIQAVLLHCTAIAGFERNVQPTAVFAVAGSGVAMNAYEHLWLNPAASASVSSTHASLFYAPSPFQLPQLSHYGISVAHPYSFGTISLGAHTLGFPLYRESNVAFAYARPLTNEFCAGIALHVYHLAIQKYGSATKVGADIGGIFSLAEELSIGLTLGNVNGPDIGDGEEIPRFFSFGTAIRPVGSAVITFDIVKDIRFPATYRAGIEFSPIDAVALRTGLQGDPSRIFGGVSIIVAPFAFHYGIGTHTDLGLTHSIGISFAP
ncbi:MAG: hypothetical protein ACYC09_12735 [Bacteroidota bacterium]